MQAVFAAGKHLEVHTLMITNISDNEAAAKKTANRIFTELRRKVPLHFVRFHRDYKLRKSV